MVTVGVKKENGVLFIMTTRGGNRFPIKVVDNEDGTVSISTEKPELIRVVSGFSRDKNSSNGG